MKQIKDFQEGDSIRNIFYCKQRKTITDKNGKDLWIAVLQDSTGMIDAKVRTLSSPAIIDFDAGDFVEVYGEAYRYQNEIQINVKQTRIPKENEYNPDDFFPKAPIPIETLWERLEKHIDNVKNEHLHTLLADLFIGDDEFKEAFQKSSAAKSIHHAYIGGLLYHTVCVADVCTTFAKQYKTLNSDLLISAALLHDIGKTEELSRFPENDYTDAGNLLGHIVLGTIMIHERIAKIPDFPPELRTELEHCILAHHGQLEYGSPKTPMLMEAFALNMADNLDAKLATFGEAIDSSNNPTEWQYNKALDTSIRGTSSTYNTFVDNTPSLIVRRRVL